MTDQRICLNLAASMVHLVTDSTQQLHPPLCHGAILVNKENQLSRSVRFPRAFAAHRTAPIDETAAIIPNPAPRLEKARRATCYPTSGMGQVVRVLSRTSQSTRNVPRRMQILSSSP